MKKIFMGLLLLAATSVTNLVEGTTLYGIQQFQWTGAATGYIVFLSGTGPDSIDIDEDAQTIIFTWEGTRYIGHYHDLTVDNNLYTAGLDDINEMEAG